MATVFRCDLIVRNALIFDGTGASRPLRLGRRQWSKEGVACACILKE